MSCNVENCDRAHYARGLCRAHYVRHKRDRPLDKPLKIITRNQTPKTRLLVHSMPEPNTGCWLWTASLDENGYARMQVGTLNTGAHRVAYEEFVGPIPDGLQIDHLCRVRCCVNPDHLEPVTPKENTQRGDNNNRRKTHCPQGHPYSGDNLVVTKNGKGRECRTCQKEFRKKRWQEKRR